MLPTVGSIYSLHTCTFTSLPEYFWVIAYNFKKFLHLTHPRRHLVLNIAVQKLINAQSKAKLANISNLYTSPMKQSLVLVVVI